MRILITALAVISGLSEGVALPVTIRDGVAVRRAFERFTQRPGAEFGTVSSVLKARQSFLVEEDVRELSAVVEDLLPKPRPWLTWLAIVGVIAGTAAGVIAVWT